MAYLRTVLRSRHELALANDVAIRHELPLASDHLHLLLHEVSPNLFARREVKSLLEIWVVGQLEVADGSAPDPEHKFVALVDGRGGGGGGLGGGHGDRLHDQS